MAVFNFFRKKKKEKKEVEAWGIDLKKRSYIGAGSELVGEETNKVEPIYIPWETLARHFSVYGTASININSSLKKD